MLRRVYDLKPAYLITGDDRPKVVRAVRRLRARVGEEAAELLSATDVTGDDAVAACNALGLFADERRLVVVDDVERWKAPDAAAVASYLENPAPTTVLALVGELPASSPLVKAVSRVGEVLKYELPKRGTKADVPAWVAKQFAALGIDADRAVCRALVELVGTDPTELSTEIDKLAGWAAGDAIREQDVVALVAARAEAPPFALTDAWGRRDVAGVLAASEHLLERSGVPSRDELPRVAGLLTSHIRRVLECQALSASDVPAREAAERLRKNRFYVQKLYEQAANFSVEELRAAIVRLAALDLGLKGASKLPGELELDRALVDVTRAPDPARER